MLSNANLCLRQQFGLFALAPVAANFHSPWVHWSLAKVIHPQRCGGLPLADYGSFGWASFSGKATYLEPGWPELIGNHAFVAYVEDRGEPGANADRFWIEVHDSDGNPVILSLPPEAIDNALVLKGGNISVPNDS